MKYMDWNNRLALHFFNEEMDGREVILDVSRELIESIGAPDFGLSSFIECVEHGPDWVTRQGLCMKAHQAFENWRDRKLEFPPYLAYLCLFVLPNDVEGEFNPNAYFPRLNSLLGIPEESGALPSFRTKIWQLWLDLEEWSVDDKNTELGRFTARMRGKMAHIGFPLSQTVLKREDRNRIPHLFDAAGLEPGQSVPSEILMSTLRPNARQFLSARTARLLRDGKDNADLRAVLLQILHDELLDWDGRVESSVKEGNPQTARFGVHLCLTIEGFGNKVTSHTRLRILADFPSPFYFHVADDPNEVFSCKEAGITDWSTRIRKQNENESWDSTGADWQYGVRFVDETNGWSGGLRQKNIRLFVRGRQNYSLPEDWVESHQNIQPDSAFAIACEPSISGEIKEWVEKHCDQSRSPISLDNGWDLFFAENATASFTAEPALTLSSEASIALRGGFKKGRGTQYFDFGLPRIVLENARADEIRLCTETDNEIELEREDGASNAWIIPVMPPIGERLQINPRIGGNDIELRRNVSIRIITESNSPFPEFDPPKLDSFGAMISNETESTNSNSGEMAVQPITEAWSGPAFLPLQLGITSILIGKSIGQVAEFPTEEVPEEWKPVWVLSKQARNKWIVSYCGNDLGAGPSESNLPVARQKLWKEHLWINRNQHSVEQIKIPIVKRLWDLYKKVAKNA